MTSRAQELWQELRSHIKLRKTTEAVLVLTELVQVDPAAPRDPEVHAAIVDLAVSAYLPPAPMRAKMQELLTDGMGPLGVDIIFDIFISKGGTEAWNTAGRLLADPALRARGSAAMRIAYDLRMSKCSEKPGLFGRAASEGDHRALGELQMLKSCRRNSACCLSHDDGLDAAVRAILARE